MLYDLSVGNAKEILKGGMAPAEITFADTKNERAFREKTMDALMVDVLATFAFRFQC